MLGQKARVAEREHDFSRSVAVQQSSPNLWYHALMASSRGQLPAVQAVPLYSTPYAAPGVGVERPAARSAISALPSANQEASPEDGVQAREATSFAAPVSPSAQPASAVYNVPAMSMPMYDNAASAIQLGQGSLWPGAQGLSAQTQASYASNAPQSQADSWRSNANANADTDEMRADGTQQMRTDTFVVNGVLYPAPAYATQAAVRRLQMRHPAYQQVYRTGPRRQRAELATAPLAAGTQIVESPFRSGRRRDDSRQRGQDLRGRQAVHEAYKRQALLASARLPPSSLQPMLVRFSDAQVT